MFEFMFSQSRAAFLCVHSFVHIATWALFMTFMMSPSPLSSSASPQNSVELHVDASAFSLVSLFFSPPDGQWYVQNRHKSDPMQLGPTFRVVVFGVRRDHIPPQPKRISLTRSINHLMTALRYMSVCCILSFLSIAYPICTCAERDKSGQYLHCRIFLLVLHLFLLRLQCASHCTFLAVYIACRRIWIYEFEKVGCILEFVCGDCLIPHV
jgi:hypothetical protein